MPSNFYVNTHAHSKICSHATYNWQTDASCNVEHISHSVALTRYYFSLQEMSDKHKLNTSYFIVTCYLRLYGGIAEGFLSHNIFALLSSSAQNFAASCVLLPYSHHIF